MKKELHGKTVILGITGGIAAYKACEVTRRLKELGLDVHVILTDAAKHFVTPLTLQALSGNRVHTDMFDLPQEMAVGHIALADKADVVLVAPACANTMAKVAHGICDDLLTTVICATQAIVAFAPAMNVHMWENPITQDNVTTLKKAGYQMIEPEAGFLACGYEGKGRLAEVDNIVNAVVRHLKSGASKKRGRK